MERIQELNACFVPLLNGKVLLLKRKDSDLWEFPGGGVDWGENPEVSAKRELKEETGLSAKTCKFLGITSAAYEKEGKEKHSVYIVYSGEVGGEDFFIGEEHSSGRWVSLAEVKFMKLALNCEDIPDMLEK